ncbi:putative chaperone protein DnaJ [Eubacterium ramulus ATCC 29099]|uniref:Putative chaperone protein DnaJ n=1 Tax=Eubacterium ramulus ATCC 29099 TaxID=1256908 RepID=U2RJC7_EUBRA|nr:putative chaperone protein DnaJ [Eubacterium ramulus ATCC 29099]
MQCFNSEGNGAYLLYEERGKTLHVTYRIYSKKWMVICMAAKQDYYELLGVAKNADATAIKKAYRKLAKKYHPDTNAGDPAAEQKFKDVTEAYTILSDPEKRKLYDQFGHAAFDGSMPEGGAYQYSGAGAGQNGGYQEFHFNGADMGDMFGDIFGDMFHGRSNGGGRSYSFHSDGNGGFHQYYSNGSGAGGFGQDGHFGDFGSSGGFGRGQFRQKGSDIHADVTVSFDDAAFGCEKMIHLQDGNGQIQSLKVNIPAGIDTGKTVRLKGKGNPGFNGGEAGDLLLKVTVGDRAGFERKGMDVYTNITIPFTTAVLGGEAVVPTLTGNVVCSIRPGTQSGSKIRLRGKGIVSMKDKNIHGDEYAVVQIQVPKNLNETAKEKLREFAKAC